LKNSKSKKINLIFEAINENDEIEEDEQEKIKERVNIDQEWVPI